MTFWAHAIGMRWVWKIHKHEETTELGSIPLCRSTAVLEGSFSLPAHSLTASTAACLSALLPCKPAKLPWQLRRHLCPAREHSAGHVVGAAVVCGEAGCKGLWGTGRGCEAAALLWWGPVSLLLGPAGLWVPFLVVSEEVGAAGVLTPPHPGIVSNLGHPSVSLEEKAPNILHEVLVEFTLLFEGFFEKALTCQCFTNPS